MNTLNTIDMKNELNQLIRWTYNKRFLVCISTIIQ